MQVPLELWSHIMNYIVGIPAMVVSEPDLCIKRVVMIDELKSCERFRARRDVMTITQAVLRYCNRFPLWCMKSDLITHGYKKIIHHKQRRYLYSEKPYVFTFDDVYMFFSNGTTYVSVHQK